MEPDGRDAERLDVVEFLCEACEVPDAVARAVGEGAHVHLVDDGVFVPVDITGAGHRVPCVVNGVLACTGSHPIYVHITRPVVRTPIDRRTAGA